MFGQIPKFEKLKPNEVLEYEIRKLALKNEDGSYLVLMNEDELSYPETLDIVKVTGLELVSITCKVTMQFPYAEKKHTKERKQQ